MKILNFICWAFVQFTTVVFELFTLFGRRTLFQQRAGEFCQRSTLHGVADWYRADTPHMKVFWTVFFMGAIGAAVYGCYAILEQYLASPIVVSYFVKQPDESIESLRIPDVVVCPFNRFDKTFFDKHRIESDLVEYIEFSFGKFAKHPVQTKANENIMKRLKKFDSTMLHYARALNETLSRMNMTFNEFLDAASVQCRDVIVSCSHPMNDCCSGQSVMSGSGKCYRINGTKQDGSGYPFAMSIVIRLPKDRYSFSSNNIIGDGIAVKLAEEGKGVDFDLTFIPMGTHALMPLRATKYDFINDPPRYECSNDKTNSYSHMACMDSCPWEIAQNFCRCSHPAVFPSNLPTCTAFEYHNCLINQKHYPKNLLKDCRKKCLPRCEYVQYSTSLSYANFPSKEAESLTSDNNVWESMKNSIILDVYYERFESTVIKHYPAMTVNTFIANIGGQYSLWLGGSVLTLIQVFVFLMQYLFNKCYGQLSPNGAKSGDKTAIRSHRNNVNASDANAAIVVRLARECSNSIGWDADERQHELQNRKQISSHHHNNSTHLNHELNSSLMDQTPISSAKHNDSNSLHCREFLF